MSDFSTKKKKKKNKIGENEEMGRLGFSYCLLNLLKII